MSPLGIQRTVAILAIISPFIFIPGVFKDTVFIIMGVLLFVSTLDLKRRQPKIENHGEESNT